MPGNSRGASARRPASRRPRFEIDRIVLLRVFAVIIVLAFLGLIAKVAMIAFGSGERRAQQVERSLHPAPAPSQ